MANVDVSYAGVLGCGTSEKLPSMGLGAACLALLRRHGGDAVEVERLTTTWAGTLTPGGPEQWGRASAPSSDTEASTWWQVLRWRGDAAEPQWWNCSSFSEAVAAARGRALEDCTNRVLVTRVVCERIGVVTRSGHVYGPALRRLVAPELGGNEAREVA